MKMLLLALLFSICSLAFYAQPLLDKFVKPAAVNPAVVKSAAIKSEAAHSVPSVAVEKKKGCLSINEFAAQGKTDVKSYTTFLECQAGDQKAEPLAIDKLMNFLAHGKYE